MNSSLSFFQVCTFIIFLSIFSSSSAQKDIDYKALDSEAQAYFRLEEYFEALPIYLKLDSLKPDNPAVSARIGICYLHTDFKYKALPYLEEAIAKGYQKDFIDYFIAHAYHLDHQFDKAISYYEISKKYQTQDKAEGKDRIRRISRYIEMCNSGKELVKTPVEVKIENLSSKINSSFPDYAPVISADESVLIFTSRRYNTTGGEKNEQGYFNEDIYISYKENDKWTDPENMGSNINTEGHDASVGLSADGQELLIYRHDGEGDIYYSNLNSSIWSFPKKLSGAINTPTSYEPSASISPDEKIIFFSSDRPGGYGGRDIYVSQKLPNNEWSAPKNMGPKVNTVYDEDAPFIHADGTTLYFSSNGHNSMGGFDIFSVQYNSANNDVSGLSNLGYPINTADDELFFVWSADGARGYFSSVRAKDNFGGKDIYMLTRPKPPVSVVLLKGKVFSKTNQKPIDATITVTDNATNQIIGVYNSNNLSGKYALAVPPGKNYGITMEAPQHLPYSENISVSNKDYSELHKDVFLDPLETGSIAVLKNVFFDPNSATLKKESQIELDKFCSLLKENPTLSAEVAGHTDNAGDDKSNLELSQKRAVTVTKYLADKGIESKRLCAVGYGEKHTVASNNTEEGKQQNRRIEIILIPNPASGKKVKECKGYYNQKQTPLAKNSEENNELNTEPGRKLVNGLPHIQFDFNSYNLEELPKKNLELWGRFLLDNKSVKIEIGGHTDGKGSGEYNKVLAEKRVATVKDYLVSTGVNPDRITTVSYGKSKPIASNKTEAGRKKNRRVELTILH